MPAWGDHGICRACFDGERSDRVEVRSSPGARLGDPEVWSREQVVAGLALGATLITLMEVPGGGWCRSGDANAVQVGDEIHVRTDYRRLAKDFLGELPRM